jgi:hypothetical protein
METLRLWPAAVTAVVLGASLACAGYRLTDAEGDETLVSKGRVKEVSGQGEGPQSVFDLGAARAWISNPQTKVYWEGTIDELCTTVQQTAAAVGKSMERSLEAQLSKLSPEARAKVEELRKAMVAKRAAEDEQKAGPGVIRVDRTGETATIAGQSTRKYREGVRARQGVRVDEPRLGVRRGGRPRSLASERRRRGEDVREALSPRMAAEGRLARRRQGAHQA